jgi:MFS family permease
MDLDNIKKTWQQTDLKPTIGEEKIQKMLDNKGQSAFNSIMRYEKYGIIGLIICTLVAYPLFSRYMPVFYFYLIACIIGIIWQIHKFSLLKNANIAELSITKAAKFYYQYKGMIIKELIISCVLFFFFIMIFGYFELAPRWNTGHFKNYLVIFGVSVIVGVVFGVVFFKKIYWNNLKRIEKSLKEIECFENENNN